jgi:cytochrome c oxidase subunit IV
MPKHRILPFRVYAQVAGALLFLTLVTVAVSFLDLGGWNAIVALAIAGTKAMLVVLYFMHLKYDRHINFYVFMIGVLFVTVFIGLTMFDTLRRADIYEIQSQPIQPDAKIYQKQL